MGFEVNKEREVFGNRLRTWLLMSTMLTCVGVNRRAAIPLEAVHITSSPLALMSAAGAKIVNVFPDQAGGVYHENATSVRFHGI